MLGSVVGGEHVERVRFVFLDGQAVLASGFEASMAHELGDHNYVGSSANQSCGEGVPQDMGGGLVVQAAVISDGSRDSARRQHLIRFDRCCEAEQATACNRDRWRKSSRRSAGNRREGG